MRTPLLIAAAAVALTGATAYKAPRHLNPMIDLLSAGKPMFGLYAPSNRRGRGPVPADAPPPKSPAELAQEAVAHPNTDFLFDGSLEGDWDRAFPVYAEFAKGWADQGTIDRAAGAPQLRAPLVTKAHKIAENVPLAQERIARQLDLGVTTIMFPEVESAEEVKAGLAAMRFKSQGGTRPDDHIAEAAKRWGISEAEYRKKADLWPLNPNGELTNWTIVESKEGLKHVREIAAVKGISVLWPGAGTLRGVFTDTTGGQRKFDAAGWENAIQQVLAACKEFHVPCGYPANEKDIEERMRQGFTVFVMNWGEPGFRAVEIGKKAAGR